MLKRFAILILLLCIFCVQGHTKTQKAKRGDNRDSPSPTVASPKQSDSPNLQPEPQKHVDADIRVVSSPAKDRYGKVAFWINVLLACVGCAGVGAGVCTLLVINKQAREAKLQRIVTHNTLNVIKEQGALMKRQADIMDQQVQIVVNKERARIFIELAPASWKFLEPGYEREMTEFNGNATSLENDVFQVLIRNEGATKALDARFIATVTVKEPDKILPVLEHTQMHYIGILPSEEDAPRKLGVELFPGMSQEMLNAIHDERATISFAGFVRYQDVLSSPNVFRETGFSYEWKGFSDWVGAIAEDPDGSVGDFQITHFDWMDYPKAQNYQT